jgi:hypothetical protein
MLAALRMSDISDDELYDLTFRISHIGKLLLNIIVM